MSKPENLSFLAKKDWVTDYGLRKHLNAHGTIHLAGDYFVREKSYKLLIDLLINISEGNQSLILFYFDLPNNTIDFARWIWDWVAYQDPLPEEVDHQLEVLPYPELYKIFPKYQYQNVMVYVFDDRIEDASGQKLAKLKKPTKKP